MCERVCGTWKGKGGAELGCLTACLSVHLPSARNQLLERNPHLSTYTRFSDGHTPLHAAAAAGSLELLQTLCGAACAAAADGGSSRRRRRTLARAINGRNSGFQTPLMLAAQAGAADCVAYLLSQGADPTLLDSLHMRCVGWGGVAVVVVAVVVVHGGEALHGVVDTRW